MIRSLSPCLVAAALASAANAAAEPYRLRGDALAQAESPVGLLALTADGDVRPWLSAEAVVWTVASSEDGASEADALVIAVRIRDPEGRADAKLGRFVATAGALRPTHLDGVAGLVRLPWHMRLEVFGGVPVEPRFSMDAFGWTAGTRVSRALGDWGSVGLAYLHRRDAGDLADEEIGADAAYAPTKWLDLGGRVALDLIDTGVSEAAVSSAIRRGAWRVEAFGLHRSPSRILPATSLFSVIGDVASQRVGASTRWRAAPRLDLDSTLAVRRLGDELGESLSARALLRLDDLGRGAVSLELRREAAPDADWSGVRATGRFPLGARIRASTELELVIPDDPRGRGQAWPWALVALSWSPADRWLVAAALEASASPEFDRRVDGLVRLSRAWEIP